MATFLIFVGCAATRSTVLRALGIAGFVAPLLTAINHGREILRGEWDAVLLGQAALTFCIPYCVSTFSSARAEMAHRRPEERVCDSDA